METPDKIKKSMEHCAGSRPCAECAYDNRDFPYCIMRQRADALAYIQQLEAQNAELQAERDAAVADITQMVQEPYSPCYCDYCKLTEEECSKSNCRGRNAFVWRGVQKEETDEND